MKIEPWQQQADEGAKAFAAFCTYRDLGTERSIDKANQDIKKSRSLVGRWCVKHHWVERCRAWDEYLDQQTREELRRGVGKMAQRHANVAQVMLAKVAEKLRGFNAADLTTESLPKWFMAAVEVERLSRGEPTELVDATLRAGVIVVPAKDLTSGDWQERVSRDKALTVEVDDDGE